MSIEISLQKLLKEYIGSVTMPSKAYTLLLDDNTCDLPVLLGLGDDTNFECVCCTNKRIDIKVLWTTEIDKYRGTHSIVSAEDYEDRQNKSCFKHKFLTAFKELLQIEQLIYSIQFSLHLKSMDNNKCTFDTTISYKIIETEETHTIEINNITVNNCILDVGVIDNNKIIFAKQFIVLVENIDKILIDNVDIYYSDEDPDNSVEMLYTLCRDLHQHDGLVIAAHRADDINTYLSKYIPDTNDLLTTQGFNWAKHAAMIGYDERVDKFCRACERTYLSYITFHCDLRRTLFNLQMAMLLMYDWNDTLQIDIDLDRHRSDRFDKLGRSISLSCGVYDVTLILTVYVNFDKNTVTTRIGAKANRTPALNFLMINDKIDCFKVPLKIDFSTDIKSCVHDNNIFKSVLPELNKTIDKLKSYINRDLTIIALNNFEWIFNELSASNRYQFKINTANTEASLSSKVTKIGLMGGKVIPVGLNTYICILSSSIFIEALATKELVLVMNSTASNVRSLQDYDTEKYNITKILRRLYFAFYDNDKRQVDVDIVHNHNLILVHNDAE